eukprot:356232-Chlamydomonas_euryale.AAC.21
MEACHRVATFKGLDELVLIESAIGRPLSALPRFLPSIHEPAGVAAVVSADAVGKTPQPPPARLLAEQSAMPQTCVVGGVRTSKRKQTSSLSTYPNASVVVHPLLGAASILCRLGTRGRTSKH